MPPTDRDLAEADLLDCLKSATASSHRQLEQSLGLLQQPLSAHRFTAVLRGFYGFHVVWEASFARFPDIQRFAADRTKVRFLAQDLAALGDSDIAAIAACHEAADLAQTQAEMIGALYVLEGSTLGGRVIATALAEAPWLPANGLTYFNPYGQATGAMWQRFKQWARAFVPPRDWPEAERGAVRTFDLLARWLPSQVVA